MNGKERITDCPAVNDGRWHHIGVTWRSTDGDWRIYIDGSSSDGGKGLSRGSTIPGTAIPPRPLLYVNEQNVSIEKCVSYSYTLFGFSSLNWGGL